LASPISTGTVTSPEAGTLIFRATVAFITKWTST
jgi:hypothetical protein